MIQTKSAFLGTFVGRILLDVRSKASGVLSKLSVDETHMSLEMTLADGTIHQFDGQLDAFGYASNAIFVAYGPSLRMVEQTVEKGSLVEVTVPKERKHDVQKILAITMVGAKFTALRPNLNVIIKSVNLEDDCVKFHFISADGQTLPSDYESLKTTYDNITPFGFSEPGMFVGHSRFERTPHNLN